MDVDISQVCLPSRRGNHSMRRLILEGEQTSARIELQTVTRLPKTKAILFSFKTYLYPLAELKEEGLGPQLADAIEGLKTGNAPSMWTYKGGVRWGKSVCTYLRQ